MKGAREKAQRRMGAYLFEKQRIMKTVIANKSVWPKFEVVQIVEKKEQKKKISFNLSYEKQTKKLLETLKGKA